MEDYSKNHTEVKAPTQNETVASNPPKPTTDNKTAKTNKQSITKNNSNPKASNTKPQEDKEIEKNSSTSASSTSGTKCFDGKDFVEAPLPEKNPWTEFRDTHKNKSHAGCVQFWLISSAFICIH